MKEIKQVVILGAGAMGAYFSSRFFETEGFTVALAAAGERLNRLKNGGFVLNEKHYLLPVINTDESATPPDLIIVALKHQHLSTALGEMKNLVGDDTTIISVMNGLDSEKSIGSIFGMEKVLYAISVGIDAVRKGNEVTYTNPGKHIFGQLDNTQLSDQVRRVQQAFEKAGINYETPTDMLRMMWWKFMINVGMNPSSAVMRATYGVFQTSPDARFLMEALMKEVIILAKAEGVDLTDQDLQAWYSVLDTLSPQGKTSMLQDMEGGFKTEVEVFSEKVVQLGKTHKIPTPFNQAVLNIVKVLEQKKDP